MKKNAHVFYNGKKYVIIYMYSSGYCEIRAEDKLHKVELVHLSEITMAS
ncbi:hypothetical protein HPT25_10950 [Bacillus sp. BRMEA1]|nr:hypothetical protein [Neobacillus endophyticus]NRD77900.1 hypothetical protein [Neobacillus endophyticus]